MLYQSTSKNIRLLTPWCPISVPVSSLTITFAFRCLALDKGFSPKPRGPFILEIWGMRKGLALTQWMAIKGKMGQYTSITVVIYMDICVN